ncbi:MAG: nitronate monooxygenase [Alphaproteobacteria bacterium]|nr:nitronate monooxygenase [Alphaproteobacteria bacterium]
MLHTAICDLLGLRLPIFQGALGPHDTTDLAVAVSRAGGLGMISSIHGTDVYGDTKRQVARLVEAGGSFGINFPVKSPDGPARLRGALDSLAKNERARRGLRIVVTSAGSPTVFNKDIRAAHLHHFHVVATVEHAMKAVDAGCTGLIVEGNESGGHVLSAVGPTSMTLIPAVIERVDVPVIAAGGFVDGKGLIAALALGAVGISMGTRFYMTREANGFAPPKIQAALVKAGVGDTAVVPSVFGPNRHWRNSHVNEILARVAKGETLADLADLKKEGAAAHAAGNADRATVPIGMGVGRVDSVRSVAELLDDIVAGARQTLDALARLG